MSSELTITIKNDESRYTQKFLLYDIYQFNETDPVIANCLEQAKSNFGKNEITDIIIKAQLNL